MSEGNTFLVGDVASLLAEAEALVEAGRSRQAIAILSARNRASRVPEIECRLVQLRHAAFEAPAEIPPEPVLPGRDPMPGQVGAPEIDAGGLDAEVLAGALAHHGSLMVRGFLGSDAVELLTHDIDGAFDAMGGLASAGERTPEERAWFSPFDAGANDLGGPGRFWAAAAGTIWAAESPRSFFDLVDALDETPIRQVLTRRFGEPPALSVVKTSIRRIPPDAPPGWHQDAYVYGLATRTVNVWVALSRCGEGTGSPGLDFVPRAFTELADPDLPPPPPLAIMSDETIARVSADHPVCSPVFEPGDALLFDSLFLHQTGARPGLTIPRYSLECWFFAPSTFPLEWVPLVY